MTGNQQPRGLVGRLVTASLGLLVAAVALTLAFDLLTRIWFWLVLIAVLSGVVIVAIWIARRRRRW